MKHLKTFESSYINNIEVGDYALCIDTSKFINPNDAIVNYIKNNIGVVVKIYRNDYTYPIYVKYDNIPIELKMEFISYFGSDSGVKLSTKEVATSKNKEDLIMLIQINKYNL